MIAARVDPQDSNSAPPTLACTQRADWRWMLLVVSLGIGLRLPAWYGAESYVNADNAIAPLMAHRIAQGGYWPLMCDGQDYLGAADAYLAAPWDHVFPGMPQGYGMAQLLVLGVLLVVIYPLLYAVGGHAGAVAGELLLAVGCPEQHELSVLPPLGYLSNLVIGMAVLRQALVVQSAPTAWRLAVLGWLCGVGWWNNPQIAQYAGVALFMLWCRGALLDAHGRGLRQMGWVERALLVALALGLLAVAACAWMPALGGVHLDWGLLHLSLGRPDHYLPRAIIGCVLVVLGLEWRLAASRGEWCTRAASFSAGAVLGAAPLLLHHLLGRTAHVPAWMRYRVDEALYQWPRFVDQAGRAVLGTPLVEFDHVVYRIVSGVAWTLLAVCACAACVALRSELAARLGLSSKRQPCSPLLMMLLPAVVLTAVLFVRGGATMRYCLAYWPALAALVAWVVGRLWSCGVPQRVLALALLGVLLLRGAIDLHGWWLRLPSERIAADRSVIERLVADGATVGFAQYWVAVKLTYLSNERLRLGVDYDAVGNYHRFVDLYDDALAVPYPVHVFDLVGTYEEDRLRSRQLLEHHELSGPSRHRPSGVMLRRWRCGRYVAFQWRAQ